MRWFLEQIFIFLYNGFLLDIGMRGCNRERYKKKKMQNDRNNTVKYYLFILFHTYLIV